MEFCVLEFGDVEFCVCGILRLWNFALWNLALWNFACVEFCVWNLACGILYLWNLVPTRANTHTIAIADKRVELKEMSICYYYYCITDPSNWQLLLSLCLC